MEGAELEVLKTFDFKAVTVDVVCIEQDGGNPETGVVETRGLRRALLIATCTSHPKR